MSPMKRKPTLEDSELLVPDLPEPDLSDIEHFHELVASGRLVDVLTNVAGLADAIDSDPSVWLRVTPVGTPQPLAATPLSALAAPPVG